MKYIRGTRDIPLVLSTNGSGVLKWLIGSLYIVHTNLRVYKGGGISIGRGLPIVALFNQKLNTHSSTESDIVKVHNCMMDLYWTRYFMEAQGNQVIENMVYQDKKIAISWIIMGSHQVSSSPITSTFVSF